MKEKGLLLLIILLLFIFLFVGCPDESYVEREKKEVGVDLLEKYSTVEFNDIGKGETIAVPMEFEWFSGLIGSNRVIHHINLSDQEYNNPNKEFTVTIKMKLSEGIQGFTILLQEWGDEKIELVSVGEKTKKNNKELFWSKIEDGYALFKFKWFPKDYSYRIGLYWETDDEHYLHGKRTFWDCSLVRE